MLKVLVVDDNNLIRASIVKKVPCENLDLIYVGQAANGIQAQEQIAILSPDIVITDVKMPLADGFAVISHCREKGLATQFIIISGYDDFHYLKQAIQAEAITYILKPISTGELVQALKSAARKVLKMREIKKTAEDAMHYAHALDEQRKNDILTRLLLGHMSYNEGNLYSSDWFPAFDFEINVATVVLNIPDKVALSDEEITKIKGYTQEVMHPINCRIISIYPTVYAIVLLLSNEHQILAEHLLKLQCMIRSIKKNSPIYLSFGKTGCKKDICTSFYTAVTQMLQRFTAKGHKSVFPYTEKNESFVSLSDLETIIEHVEKTLSAGNIEQCMLFIKQILFKIAQNPNQTYSYFSALFVALHPWISSYSADNHIEDVPWGLQLLRYPDLDSLLLCFQTILANTLKSQPQNIVEAVLSYLQIHYTESLTLQELSEHFYLSSAYLGQLIRKTTGKTFHTLLNDLRIEKAIQIGRRHSLYCNQRIAELVGFGDPNYFSKVFKAKYGMSFSEYRQKKLQSEHDCV